MLELRPTEVPTTRPKILLVDHWIKFSNGFPDSLDHVRGKTASIIKQQQVPYELTYVLKEDCYVDINLSNESAGQKLYPDATSNLYEVLIGFKPGNYLCQIYFPADHPIYGLDYAIMVPLITSDTYKYLGAIKPEDSPADDPKLKLYLVYKLTPMILRIYADDGVAYEKATINFLVNRCAMKFGPAPADVKPKPIFYLDEIKWIGR